MVARIARASIPVVQQLMEWAERAGVMLFPRAYPFPTLTGTLSTASRAVQPDGGFICVGIVGLSFAIGNTRVSIDNLQSGGRRLIDGTLRLQALLDGLESDGMEAAYLPAHIAVMPGDYLTYVATCEVAGETFANGGGANYETAAFGYGLHDAKTGAKLEDHVAREKLLQLLRELGEFRALGVEGSGVAIDTSASPMKAMTCEVVAAQGIAPTNTTAARLTIGTYEVVPPSLTLPQTALAFRAPGMILNPNTRVQLRNTNSNATTRAHAAILGRAVEA